MANGYAFNLATVELGVRQYEDVGAADFPYVGIYGGLIASEPYEIADGSLLTRLQVGGVGHLQNADPLDVVDARQMELYDDIRRAIVATAREAYDGVVNSGLIFDDPLITSSEPDKGITWARERATVNFLVAVTLYETSADIVNA